MPIRKPLAEEELDEEELDEEEDMASTMEKV